MKVKISVHKLAAALLVLNNPDDRKVTSGLWILGSEIFASNGYCYYSDAVDKNKHDSFVYIPRDDVMRIAHSGKFDKDENITLQELSGIWLFKGKDRLYHEGNIETATDEEIAQIEKCSTSANSDCIENMPPDGLNGEYLKLGIDVINTAGLTKPHLHITQNGNGKPIILQSYAKSGSAKFYISPVGYR